MPASSSSRFWFSVRALALEHSDLFKVDLLRTLIGLTSKRILNPLPDLAFRTLDGEQRHLASLKGQVVFLDLWGTWCVQCVAEMPTVQKLYNHYRGNPSVKFLIVSRMDSSSTVRSYARRNHLDLPFFLTEDQDIPRSMQLNQFPATFIYAADGSLVTTHIGAADWSDPTVYNFIDGLMTR